MHECLEHPPVIPDLFVDIWRWFLDLTAQRQDGNSLSWSDIHAYCNLTDTKPSKWDLELLSALDDAWLNVMHRKDD